MSTPTPAATVKRLMREAWRGVLATRLTSDDDGAWPYASLVLVACDADGAPLLFLSDLAAHSANLRRAPQASILFDGTLGLDEPLTGPRATVLGPVTPIDDARALDRYVRRHPGAVAYRAFGDFRLWRMTPERAHLVAGFGQIRWVEADALAIDPHAATAIARAEAALLDELNGAGAALIETLGQTLDSGADWRLVGLDPAGADLMRADGKRLRTGFPAPISTPEEVKAALEALLQ